jgi:hypothetical protein
MNESDIYSYKSQAIQSSSSRVIPKIPVANRDVIEFFSFDKNTMMGGLGLNTFSQLVHFLITNAGCAMTQRSFLSRAIKLKSGSVQNSGKAKEKIILCHLILSWLNTRVDMEEHQLKNNARISEIIC